MADLKPCPVFPDRLRMWVRDLCPYLTQAEYDVFEKDLTSLADWLETLPAERTPEPQAERDHRAMERLRTEKGGLRYYGADDGCWTWWREGVGQTAFDPADAILGRERE